jgi:hypothetical protein
MRQLVQTNGGTLPVPSLSQKRAGRERGDQERIPLWLGVETFPWSTESRDTTRELLDRRRMHLLRLKRAADGWQEIQQQIPAPQRCFRFRSYAQQIRDESRTRPRRFRRGRKLPIPTSLLIMTGVSTRSRFILVCAVATKPSSAQRQATMLLRAMADKATSTIGYRKEGNVGRSAPGTDDT